MSRTDLGQQVGDFILSRKAARRTASTLAFYQATLGQLVRFAPVWPLTAKGLQDFMLHKCETCNEVSLRTYFRAVRAFCNWLERQGRIDANPMATLERPRALGQQIPREAPPRAIKRLFAALESRAAAGNRLAVRNLAMFRLIHDTGLREGEAARLRVYDADLARHELMVRNGKGGQDRVVYFGYRAAQALENWLEIRPECEWLFVSRTRRRLRPLTPKGIYTVLQRCCRAARMERISVHMLRHAYACDALEAGIHLKHVQVQMGHKHLSTTAIYLHRRDPDRRRAHLEHSPGDWLDGLYD